MQPPTGAPPSTSILRLSADEQQRFADYLDEDSLNVLRLATTNPVLRWSQPTPTLFTSDVSRSIVQTITVLVDSPLSPE